MTPPAQLKTPLTPERLASLMTPRIVARFWKKTIMGTAEECWYWAQGLDKDGYGKFQVPLGGKRQLSMRSHRLAHFLLTGELPPAVLHRCDKPPCCNPAHLFGGTQRDNRADCVAKGRQARGETNGAAKLTDAQVAEIQRRYVPGRAVAALAREFNINWCTAWSIGTGHYPRLKRNRSAE